MNVNHIRKELNLTVGEQATNGLFEALSRVSDVRLLQVRQEQLEIPEKAPGSNRYLPVSPTGRIHPDSLYIVGLRVLPCLERLEREQTESYCPIRAGVVAPFWTYYNRAMARCHELNLDRVPMNYGRDGYVLNLYEEQEAFFRTGRGMKEHATYEKTWKCFARKCRHKIDI
jgi:hypothetical protein